MENIKLINADLNAARTEFHELLSLSGAEISYNNLPKDVEIPFVHSHKENEEFYLVLKGTGKFFADGQLFDLKEGSALKVKPAVKRCIKAGSDGISYICIQAKENSLSQFTLTDAVIAEEKAVF
ncbi:cupin domain-containing protein [Succinatimonas hippei]|uniref:cupin domain-containing protein n=1 Tax=Succinatimonas hippei TaxID=626938 RepID=UPI00201213F9|nr:cupin domain-containing protein [Succinatimonas hippei]MCL1604205.1 cupin domain-containing protein [Succinatimonas hippei]